MELWALSFVLTVCVLSVILHCPSDRLPACLFARLPVFALSCPALASYLVTLPPPLPSSFPAHLGQSVKLLLMGLQHRPRPRVRPLQQRPDLLLHRRPRLAANAPPVLLIVQADLAQPLAETEPGGQGRGSVRLGQS